MIRFIAVEIGTDEIPQHKKLVEMDMQLQKNEFYGKVESEYQKGKLIRVILHPTIKF